MKGILLSLKLQNGEYMAYTMNSENQNISVVTFLFSNTSQLAGICLYWYFTLIIAPLREVIPLEIIFIL